MREIVSLPVPKIPDFGYISQATSPSNKKNYIYLKDHLGSVVGAISKDGLEWEYEYDAYGNVTGAGSSVDESDFLYTGHFYHRPSGLYLAPYRAYNPKFGRWLSKEPLGLDGPNLYHYVGNDPFRYVDLNGLERILIELPMDPKKASDDWIPDVAQNQIPHNKHFKADNQDELDKILACAKPEDSFHIVSHGNAGGPGFYDSSGTWIPARPDRFNPALCPTNTVTFYGCRVGEKQSILDEFSKKFRGATVLGATKAMVWGKDGWYHHDVGGKWRRSGTR